MFKSIPNESSVTMKKKRNVTYRDTTVLLVLIIFFLTLQEGDVTDRIQNNN